MSTNEAEKLLADFEAGQIDPRNFPHRAHVEVSYELLERRPFPEALLHLARGLRQLAAKAGKPESYHETITAAFLSLIAERRFSRRYADWEDFAARNPDLFQKELLADLYQPDVLKSTIARRTFILPRKSRGARLGHNRQGKIVAIATFVVGLEVVVDHGKDQPLMIPEPPIVKS